MLEELDTKIITETETSTISLSTAASDAVKNILTERNAPFLYKVFLS